MIEKIISEKFICTFEMSYYPFDVQTCIVQMEVKGPTKKFVEMIADGLVFSNMSFEVGDYTVRDIVFESIVIKTNLFTKLLCPAGL